MLGELERPRKVFKSLDTSQKCIHAVLAGKSGIKSAAWMLTWDLNSFILGILIRKAAPQACYMFYATSYSCESFSCWYHFDHISSRSQIQGNVKNRELMEKKNHNPEISVP